MRKNFAIVCALALIFLGGCNPTYQNNSTRFLMNTVVNITADADYNVLNGAFSLCQEFEEKFSKTLESSEIYRLNSLGGGEVSDECIDILKKSVYYSELTGGEFDVTICSVSDLWDFNQKKIPSSNDIAEAIKSVGYKKIEITGNRVDLNGAKIDLGGIAKGYIADKVRDYFAANGTKTAIINLGGNIVLMGEEYSDVGIKNPFSQGVIATVRLKNKAVVTAGTYERAFRENGVNYHHIIDAKTGYPAKSDIVSATVICDSAEQADALSTSCVLLGLSGGLNLIENTEGVEAIFITSEGGIHISSGIFCEDGIYRL